MTCFFPFSYLPLVIYTLTVRYQNNHKKQIGYEVQDGKKGKVKQSPSEGIALGHFWYNSVAIGINFDGLNLIFWYFSVILKALFGRLNRFFPSLHPNLPEANKFWGQHPKYNETDEGGNHKKKADEKVPISFDIIDS